MSNNELVPFAFLLIVVEQASRHSTRLPESPRPARPAEPRADYSHKHQRG